MAVYSLAVGSCQAHTYIHTYSIACSDHIQGIVTTIGPVLSLAMESLSQCEWKKLIFICTGVAQEIKLELRLAIAITDGSTRYRKMQILV